MAACATRTSLFAKFKSASAASCAVFAVSAASTEVVLALNELLLALIDALGIGIVRLRLFDARLGPLKIGLSLLDGRLRSGDLRALLAVVEPGQHRAFGDAIADIGAKIDEHAGNLEPDLAM